MTTKRLPQLAGAADDGEEHALEVKVSERTGDARSVEHEVDERNRQVQSTADNVA